MREPPGPWGAGRLRCVCWAGPLCVPVGGGPPARSPHASFARSGRSRGPPWPCRRPPAPRLEARPCPPVPPAPSTQVEPGVLMIGSACLLEAQPGPAAAWLVLLGWAAVCAGGRRPAREIATRELRSEWSISKPGLVLPPPTGTAAGSPLSSKPVGPSRLMVLGASARCPARHRRLNPRRPVILARHHAPDCWGLSSGHARNTGITLFSCPRSVI